MRDDWHVTPFIWDKQSFQDELNEAQRKYNETVLENVRATQQFDERGMQLDRAQGASIDALRRDLDLNTETDLAQLEMIGELKRDVAKRQ